MALRLTAGILAVTLVPLGVVFVVLGLVVDEPDRGRPEAFLYVGAPLALTGLAFTVAFILLWRREATRRQRRRQGLRTRVSRHLPSRTHRQHERPKLIKAAPIPPKRRRTCSRA